MSPLSDIPLPLRLLVAGLRGPARPRVRTALVALGPAAYPAAPHAWVPGLGLNATHLGLHVADRCQAHGHVSLDAARLLDYAIGLLPDPEAPEQPDPAQAGVWAWGADALLAKLSQDERTVFWARLFGTYSFRPPLLLVLPTALLARFGPPALDLAHTWQAAEGSGAPRYLLLP